MRAARIPRTARAQLRAFGEVTCACPHQVMHHRLPLRRVAASAVAAPPYAGEEAMQRNKLGSSDLLVSEACLGTMTFGQQNTEAEAHEQLACAADYGVNFIDTAELYPISPARETQGRTSQYIGSWLKKQRREDWVVATKVAGRSGNMPWIPANRTQPCGEEQGTRVDAASIRAAAEAELRRLQTDYIDLFHLHWPDRYTCVFGSNQYQASNERDSTSFREQVEAIGQLIQEGKVRHWGLSNETTFGLMSHCAAADDVGVARPAVVQNCFSLIHRVAETELAEACSSRHLNVGIVPWSPLCGGALTGKYLTGDPEGSRFALWPDRYKRYNSARVKAAADKYVKIAGEAGCTPAQLALAFCKSRWFVPSTIVGATSMEQLQENLDAFDLKLPDVILKATDDVHVMHRNPTLAD